ncbi:MAG: hypothetical protein K0R59_3222 [Sphingobacterium sp.]|jgi:hypothetical protein|nr:hypothetical protein [Sphingobacterium sp.]
MKRFYYLFLLLFLFVSCTTNYYSVYLKEDTPIYHKKDTASTVYTIIPKGTKVYYTDGPRSYSKIKWKNYTGWTAHLAYSYVPVSDSSKAVLNGNSYLSGSSRYTPSSSTSSGGSVHVKGYYRKNGTYVRPHTRSSGRRR